MRDGSDKDFKDFDLSLYRHVRRYSLLDMARAFTRRVYLGFDLRNAPRKERKKIFLESKIISEPAPKAGSVTDEHYEIWELDGVRKPVVPVTSILKVDHVPTPWDGDSWNPEGSFALMSGLETNPHGHPVDSYVPRGVAALVWNMDASTETLVAEFRRIVIESRKHLPQPPSEAEVVQLYLKAINYPVLQLIDLSFYAFSHEVALSSKTAAKLLTTKEIAGPTHAERVRKTIMPWAIKATSFDYIVAYTHLLEHRIETVRAIPKTRERRTVLDIEAPSPPSIFELPIMFGSKRRR